VLDPARLAHVSARLRTPRCRRHVLMSLEVLRNARAASRASTAKCILFSSSECRHSSGRRLPVERKRCPSRRQWNAGLGNDPMYRQDFARGRSAKQIGCNRRAGGEELQRDRVIEEGLQVGIRTSNKVAEPVGECRHQERSGSGPQSQEQEWDQYQGSAVRDPLPARSHLLGWDPSSH